LRDNGYKRKEVKVKILEIVGATLYFIGFAILVPWENFTDFYAWFRKRIDAFGAMPRLEKHPVWDEKIRPFLGLCFLVLGSVINLILVVIK
jgi:hypothetical protein